MRVWLILLKWDTMLSSRSSVSNGSDAELGFLLVCSQDARWTRSQGAYARQILQGLQRKGLHPSVSVPPHIQNRRLCGHQSKFSSTEGQQSLLVVAMAFNAMAPALLELCSQLLHLQLAGRWLLACTNMSTYSHHMLGHCRVCPTRCTTAEQASYGTSQSALWAWRSTSRYRQYNLHRLLDVQPPVMTVFNQRISAWAMQHICCWVLHPAPLVEHLHVCHCRGQSRLRVCMRPRLPASAELGERPKACAWHADWPQNLAEAHPCAH